MMATTWIIDTSVANIASMRVALERIGLRVQVTRNADDILNGDRVVLPGVGNFGAGMSIIRERGIEGAIRERVVRQLPTLAVCLGMQLLCASSDECPTVKGIGVLNSRVVRLPDDQQVPQLGWNRVSPAKIAVPDSADPKLISDAGDAYFANSFCLAMAPPGWGYATTEYGIEFISAIWQGRTLCCQFHPELSGRWGLELMRRWAFAEPLSSNVTSSEGTTSC